MTRCIEVVLFASMLFTISLASAKAGADESAPELLRYDYRKGEHHRQRWTCFARSAAPTQISSQPNGLYSVEIAVRCTERTTSAITIESTMMETSGTIPLAGVQDSPIEDGVQKFTTVGSSIASPASRLPLLHQLSARPALPEHTVRVGDQWAIAALQKHSGKPVCYLHHKLIAIEKLKDDRCAVIRSWFTYDKNGKAATPWETLSAGTSWLSLGNGRVTKARLDGLARIPADYHGPDPVPYYIVTWELDEPRVP